MNAHRRNFLKGAAGLTVAVAWAGFSDKASAQGFGGPPKPIDSEAYIHIPPEGPIQFQLPHSEMGQGSLTGESMLLAEELDIGLDQLVLVPADARKAWYATSSTGGSATIRQGWKNLRNGAAVARNKLLQAAGSAWGVDPATLTTDAGVITDPASGRSAPYGQFATAASRYPSPMEVTLKDSSKFKIVGKDFGRTDTPNKVRGQAMFAIDVSVPNMKVAAVRTAPDVGGTVVSVDEGAARQVPGVKDIVTLPNAVAVTADHYWAAMKALDAMRITWAPGPLAKFSTKAWTETMGQVEGPPVEARNEGDLNVQGKKIEAVYDTPMLAHATMEPINAVVWSKGSTAEVWIGSQAPGRMRAGAAKALGLEPEAVTIHHYNPGGGFGRRVYPEGITMACQIAKQVPYPVKMIWSREEDIKNDIFRPAYHDDFSAIVGEDGYPLVWNHKITSGSCLAAFMGLPPGKVDNDAVEGAKETVYTFPAMKVDWQRRDPPEGVTVGFWRGVGPTHNLFVVESFIEELAHAAGKDPVEYRRTLLKEDKRALAVLNKAVDAFQWTKPNLGDRVGAGICLGHAFGSYICTIAEVEVSDQGVVKMRRVVSAIDSGHAVNPNSVIAQIEGGLIFGWTAALYGDITMQDGVVQQANFHDYRMMRMDEIPEIKVVLADSGDDPGGVGETGTASACAALTNAIFAATGVRIRQLPIDPNLLVKKGADGKKIAGIAPLVGVAAAAALALAEDDQPAQTSEEEITA